METDGCSDASSAERSRVFSSGWNRGCHNLLCISGHLNGSPNPGTVHARCFREAILLGCDSQNECNNENAACECTARINSVMTWWTCWERRAGSVLIWEEAQLEDCYCCYTCSCRRFHVIGTNPNTCKSKDHKSCTQDNNSGALPPKNDNSQETISNSL